MSRTGILPRRVTNINRDYTGAVKVVASAAISASDIVVVSGVSGSKMTVAQADADLGPSRTPTLLVSPHAIPLNGVGAVVPWAIIKNVNTNGSAIGNAVYLSGTAGGWSLLPPTAGAAVIRVGTVLSVHASTGVVLLNPSAHENVIDTPTAGDGVASSGILIRKPFTGGNTNTDFVFPTRATRIIDVWIVSNAGTGGNCQLKTAAGAANITDAMVPGNADLITRAASIVQANDSVAAGATIRIDCAASTPAGTMYILLQPE